MIGMRTPLLILATLMFITQQPVAAGSWTGSDSTIKELDLESFDDTRTAYDRAAQENPIQEVLYAWEAVDTFELFTPVNDKIVKSMSAISKTVTDVTQKYSIKNGKLRFPADTRVGALNSLKSDIVGAASGITGSRVKTAKGVVGIFYRDLKGIHFRRFEPGQAIALPAIATFNLQGLAPSGPPYPNRGPGGYFYHHQFEELGRGLVTMQIPENSGALTFGVTDVLYKSQSYSYDGTNFSFTPQTYMGQNGPDYTGNTCFPLSKGFARWINRLMFEWGTSFSGLYIETLVRTNNNTNDNRYPLGYYNENGSFIDLDAINTAKATLTEGQSESSLKSFYPDVTNARPQAGYVYITLDKNKFSFGTSAEPIENEDDIAAKGRPVIPTIELPISPCQRYFGVFKHADVNEQCTIANVQSKFLNPAKKFRTHPYSSGKFFFWRDAWKAPSADGFALTFKAQGDCVKVALSNKSYADRIAGSSFDASANYRIELGGDVTISKGNATLTVTKTPGTAPLATTDKTVYSDYWISYNDGQIKCGQGTEIGKNITAVATDNNPEVGIQYFSFSGDAIPVDYIDISAQPYLTATQQAAQQQKQAALDAWATDSSSQTIDAASFAGQFNWFSNRTFAVPDAGGVTFTLKRTTSAGSGLLPLIAFSEDSANGPAYTISITKDGKVSMQKRGGAAGTVSSAYSELAALQDGQAHPLWISYNRSSAGKGVFTLGTGSVIGANPLWTYTDTNPIRAIKTIAFSVASGSATAQYSAISLGAYNDLTSYTTQTNGQFTWNDGWRLSSTDQGLLSFKITKSDATPVIAIGLRNTNTPQSASSFGGADLVVVFDYTGQVYALRGDSNSQKLNQIRFSDAGDTTKANTLATIKNVSTSQPTCWLSYSNGVVNFGIETETTTPGTTTLWSYLVSPAPSGITQFSIATQSSSITIDKIAAGTALSAGSNSSNVFDLTFSDLYTMLLSSPTDTAQKFVDAINQNQHVNSAKLADTTMILANNRELFSVQQRTALAQAMTTASYAATKDATAITTYAGKMKSEVILADLLKAYETELFSIQNLSPTVSRRRLFMSKISGLKNLSDADLQKPGIVDTINETILSSLIDQTTKLAKTNLSDTEQQIVNLLNVRINAQATVLASQSPTAILNTLDTITDPNIRISTIKKLLLARRENADNDPTKIGFNATDINTIITSLTAFVDTRDQLSPQGLTNLIDTIKTAQVTPQVNNRATDLQSLVTRASSPVPFTTRVTNLKNQVTSIMLKPSSDASRQLFFSILSNLFSQQQDRTPDDLKTLTDLLATLHTLSDSEQQIVTTISKQATNASQTSTSFSTQLAVAKRTKESLYDYAMALKGMLDGKGFSTVFGEQDSALFVDELEYIADSRELLEPTQVSDVKNLITTTKLSADFASERSVLADLENEISTAYIFQDRLTYLQKELASLQNQQASTLTTPPHYFLMRFISKVENFKDAPGIATQDIFDQFMLTIINPLLRFPLSNEDKNRVQAVNTRTQSDWNAIKTKQADFAYNFTKAQAQKTNASAYINSLQNIILAIRRGDITNTTSDNATQLVVEFEKLVANRIALSDNDSAELKKSIDYAVVTSIYVQNTSLLSRLTTLAATMKDPVPFATRVAAYANDVARIQVLPSSNDDRIAFFAKLSALSQSTGNKPADAIAQMRSMILDPLNNAPELGSQEKTILANLENSAASADSQNRSANYQLMQAMQATTISGDSGLVARLTSVLGQKGTFVTFAKDDYAAFMKLIAYVVQSRELLPDEVGQDTTSIKTDIKALIMQTKLNSDFAMYAAQLDTYATQIENPFNFADRIPVLAQEVTDLINKKPAQDNPFLQRLSKKLALLTSAPGVKTEAQFNEIQNRILLPLPALLDATGKMTLKGISDKLLSDKQQILAAQKTFAYHYALASEQKDNPDTYAALLRDLMSEIRKGNVSCSPIEAQTYLTQVQSLTDRQDLLSAQGLDALRSAITFSSYYTQFQVEPYISQLAAMDKVTNTPLPFDDRVSRYTDQTRTVLNLPSTDAQRIELFVKLTGLMSAPGTPTNNGVTMLKDEIIKPLRAAMPSDKEKTTLDNLETFISKTTSQLQTATYQLAQAQKLATLPEYIAELSRILMQKDITVTFSDADKTSFLNIVSYCIGNRELLQAGEEMNSLATLVRNAQLSADFKDAAQMLATYLTAITSPYFFKDRVDSLVSDTTFIIKRRPTSDDPFLARLIARLAVLSRAPGTKTDDKFTLLETKVFGALQPFVPADKRSLMETIKNDLRAQKTILMQQQSTLAYYLTLAEEAQSNLDAYLTALQRAVALIAQNGITFMPADRDKLTTAVAGLVNARDGLTNEQTNALRTLISACQYSAIYKDAPEDMGKLNAQYAALDTPLEFDSLVRKYAQELEQVLFLKSTDALRMQYFVKLGKLQTAPGFKSAETLSMLTDTIMPRLRATVTDQNEQYLMQQLDAFVQNAAAKAQSVSYLLQQANDQSTTLYAYFTALKTVIDAKNAADSKLSFSPDDDTRIMGALASIVTNRELLTNEQTNAVKQMVSTLLWLNTFASAKDQLTNYKQALESSYVFADRLQNAGVELQAMNAAKVPGTNGRMIRFVKKMSIILDAPGIKTEQDFTVLETIVSILANIKDLPSEQKQQVATLSAAVTGNKDAIIAAQKTFAYHYQQAQTIKDNLSAYITALKDIITKKRTSDTNSQPLIAFAAPDYRTFINALTDIAKDRDALNETDKDNLLTTINYAYYAPGFSENAQYKKELNTLYNVVKQVVTFSDKIAQYITQVTAILKLDSSAADRKRFFSRLSNLQNSSEKPSMDDIIKLDTQIVQPLHNAAPSADESITLGNLDSYIATIKDQGKSLAYNIGVLSDQIKVAQANDTNFVDVIIESLNSIIIKRNAGDIVFTDEDFGQVLGLANGLIVDRELFTPAQLGRVQGLIRTIQHSSGFERYNEELNTLFTAAGTPLTFTERLEKYRKEVPESNGLKTDDPAKNATIAKVVTLMSAPGDYTKDQLDIAQTEIVNAIQYGSFTNAQKLRSAPLKIALQAALNDVNSFNRRITRAKSSPTLDTYYTALTQIIADNANNVVSMTETDYGTLLDILTAEVPLRPLTIEGRSSLYSLLQTANGSSKFTARVDYQSRLKTLMSTMDSAVDPVERITYINNTLGNMLSKPSDDGERMRFFDRINLFANAVDGMAATTVATQTVYNALKRLEQISLENTTSTLASDSEKSILTKINRKIVVLTVGVTPVTAVATTATSTGSNIIPVASRGISSTRYSASRYSR